jgi:tripartite-type tricarboxylate transporter receptor subunit TctC
MNKAVLLLTLGFAGLVLNVPTPVAALDYPTRPVRLIVGFAAGGPTDILARLMGQWLSRRLGQQFVVENRIGAGSNTATESVAKAPADGYTVLVITTSNAINTKFYGNLPFNFMQDIVPVAGLGRIFYVLAVSPSLPVKSLPSSLHIAGRIPDGSILRPPASADRTISPQKCSRQLLGSTSFMFRIAATPPPIRT